MLIRISIDSTQPLTGTAATEASGPRPFAGWLELLRVISELLAPTGPSGTSSKEIAADTWTNRRKGENGPHRD